MDKSARLFFVSLAGYVLIAINGYGICTANGMTVRCGESYVTDTVRKGALMRDNKADTVSSVARSIKPRPVSLKITDRRGRIDRKSVFFYYLSSNRQPLQVRGGQVVIPEVLPADTLFIVADRYRGTVPLGGLDSLRIVVNGDKMYSAGMRDRMVQTGYGRVPQSLISIPVSHIPVEDDVRMMAYKDLASYMRGRIAGVQIVANPDGAYEVQIRGGSSIMASNAALIILDGAVCDFDMANNVVNPLDLKSIEVLKDGSSYGAQGVNGVVIITTKTGGRR